MSNEHGISLAAVPGTEYLLNQLLAGELKYHFGTRTCWFVSDQFLSCSEVNIPSLVDLFHFFLKNHRLSNAFQL